MNLSLPHIAQPCERSRQRAWERQRTLTKPPGSLGRLEELAVRLTALQRTERPLLDRVWISVFAADHGVAEEGVSAFPQAVTRQMLHNFARGGAAIAVLARQIGAVLEIVDVGVVEPVADLTGVRIARAGNGTANFAREPAMSHVQLERAWAVGLDAAERARKASAQLFIGGEMGIANTTSATALACALLAADPESLTGPGTGLTPDGIRHKRTVVAAALLRHAGHLDRPLEILRRLGGFEIVALTSAYLHAAAASIPVLVDGFIASVAALFAVRLQASCADWLIFSHRSAEPGHRAILEALQAEPILDLSMRLGEGSGAAVVVPILRAACALHNGMATFVEAGVSCP
ncbi:MAG TPA: nicotinate-nucleotide--dimethylbenzimidazole phosphoribosyltransferase [Methylococcus sp.]|nr:nicotinate-nucleotide--dimethylbenzimidazole phosphoribosyltransferase [Methylococcus sp.]